MSDQRSRRWMDADAPLRIAPLGPAAFHVYVYLRMRANRKGCCWPSIRTIARELRLGHATVERSLRRLADAGEIRCQTEPGKVTYYWVEPTSNQKRLPTSNQKRTVSDLMGGCFQNEGGPTSNKKPNQGKEPVPLTKFINQEQECPPVGGRARVGKVGEWFFVWFREYPRRVKPDRAEKAYGAAIKRLVQDRQRHPDITTTEQARDYLLERVRLFAATPAGQAGKFCPHPTTWLNDGRYDDDPAEWTKQEDHHNGNGRPATPREAHRRAHRFGAGQTYQRDADARTADPTVGRM